MNFRAGFHRIWFVLSCIWWSIGLFVIFTADRPLDLGHMFWVAVVPPAAVLLIARIIAWVGAGFRL